MRTVPALKGLRVMLGYIALAAGVTVSGVVIGATVVAPVVSATTSTTPSTIVTSLSRAYTAVAHGAVQEGLVRLQATARTSLAATKDVPGTVWLMVAAFVALAAVLGFGWRFRQRTATSPRSPGTLTVMPVAPSSKRTPRAVLALAEAGNSPADIARRTGLALDAVALCLAVSGARQLRPPTA